MTIAAVNRLISLFADAFTAMSVEVPIAEVERYAMLIHHSMDQGRRAYHTSTHVFDMCNGMNARQVLATLFHDLVYYQLDGGFPRQADAMLKRVARAESDTVVLRAIPNDDAGLAMCAGIFGFKAGDALPPLGGLNEFLSAVVATRLLGRHLPARDLLAIAACIEATIPFRGAAAGGREPAEVLAHRVREVSNALGIPSAEAETDNVVIDAVTLANRDVASFAEDEPGTFLSTTWLLIEESNAPLAAVGVYSIQEYRRALSRMEAFLSALDPDHVFHRYRGVPGEGEFAALCAAARRNLGFACDYLGAKITTIAIIEALALLSGGDCPVSMFLGDIRSPYGKPDRVEDFLPPPAAQRRIDQQLLAVLQQGRARESLSDLTASPLTAFVYRGLGHDGIKRALQRAKKMFGGDVPPRDFLSALERDMVRAVARACAQIALSRTAPLLALEKSL
jgi:hypothetical protein